jgi:hypothetical protein
MSRVYEDEYRNYLARARAVMGEREVGQYVKFEGQLVKKLAYEEFVELWDGYLEVRQAYDEILAQDDTVNDAIVHLLRERAAELLIRL